MSMKVLQATNIHIEKSNCLETTVIIRSPGKYIYSDHSQSHRNCNLYKLTRPQTYTLTRINRLEIRIYVNSPVRKHPHWREAIAVCQSLREAVVSLHRLQTRDNRLETAVCVSLPGRKHLHWREAILESVRKHNGKIVHQLTYARVSVALKSR